MFLQKTSQNIDTLGEYMKMCFHGNQHPWVIKHPFYSLYSKYHFLNFICLPVMNSPVFPSLDDIYCMMFAIWRNVEEFGDFGDDDKDVGLQSGDM